MCTRIDGVSNDGGETYRVTFEFQYNSRLWAFTGQWIDPETDLPVPVKDYDRRTAPEEERTFRVYDEIDFGILGIDFSKALGVSLKPSSKAKAASAKLRLYAKSSPDSLFT